MKKYSRKWRKFQQEKEIRRANSKVGEPFSKAKTKKQNATENNDNLSQTFAFE